jgi:hypothetical protein
MGLSRDEIEAIRWKNSARLFRPGRFPRCEQHAATVDAARDSVAGARA